MPGVPVVANLVDPSRPPVPVLPADALQRLRAAGWSVQERLLPHRAGPEELVAGVGLEASAALVSWGCPEFTPAVHDRLPNLRFIGYCAGSVKHLVGPATFARGVAVVSAAPVIASGVAEYCLAVALWSLRDLGATVQALAQGPQGWSAKRPASRSLWGRAVGIVSASSTGRGFIALLQPFGCDIAVYDPHLDEAGARALGARRASLDEVCGQNLVSVHAPNLPATQGLLGAAQLARIPDGGLFINSSRAGVIDYAALTAELATGRFQAVLDVFPREPLPADSPLYGMPNVVLTPHTAGYSADIYGRMGREVVGDLLRWAAGEAPRMAVDARRWDLLA